ncbi:MAG TPA: nicotinate-nucleotide adenylyltransferase [Bryobacteraceae bacterium]|nr:nicotinate-nucleotide adenylyltransferase [Bryobacteraceae bacterium]
MRLAIFGGTFDPIHRAHLAIAREAVERCGLDRVLLVPAANPPHKSTLTHAPYEDRVRMAEIACHGIDRVEVSRLEEGTTCSYSIDTIEKVRAALTAGDQLLFVIGADAFAEIRTWHRWRDVAQAVVFVIVSRPGAVYYVPEGAQVVRLDRLDLAISSSDIRRQLAAGRRPQEVPAPVMEYIEAHRLYGTGPAA